MWSSIILAVLPFLIKVITMILDKYTDDKETKRLFVEFIKNMENSEMPNKLRSSLKKQLLAIQKKIDEN